MLLIGRTPIVSSRFRSHQGLSPTRTPETTRAVNRGQRSAASTATGRARLHAGSRARRPRGGHPQGLVENHANLAGDADVPQAIRPVARDFQVDGQIALDLGG